MAVGRLRLLIRRRRGTPAGPSLARLAGLLLGLWVALAPGTARCDALWHEEAQRLRVGLKIFAAVLGAVEPRTAEREPPGELHILVVHEGAQPAAKEAAASLGAIGRIRGRLLRIDVLDAQALDRYQGTPPDGIFVASVGLGGQRLRSWSEGLRTLVFSPFAGDVELGAVAGIHVSDQILPALNLPQARRAGVRFKPFLLRVAHTHE